MTPRGRLETSAGPVTLLGAGDQPKNLGPTLRLRANSPLYRSTGSFRILARRASSELRTHGFASVEGIFLPDELAEARLLLDALFARFDELSGSVSPFAGCAYDMIDPAISHGRQDQPEILHAARIEPQLKKPLCFGR